MAVMRHQATGHAEEESGEKQEAVRPRHGILLFSEKTRILYPRLEPGKGKRSMDPSPTNPFRSHGDWMPAMAGRILPVAPDLVRRSNPIRERKTMPRSIPRRRFLLHGAAVAAGAIAASAPAGIATAIDPIQRPATSRFKLSCAAYSLRKYLDLKNPTMTLEEFIAKCGAWGTDGVELTEYYFKQPITPEYVMRLKRAAAIWGLDITGTPIGNNFAVPPGDEREKQLDGMKRWIDISADLGSPAIRTFAGSPPKGTDDAQGRKYVIECLERCCEHAAKRGVFLALENHGGVVATADGLLEIVKAVKCEWVGVNLDTGNFHTEDPYGDLARCAPYAVTCQVKTEITVKGKKKEEADLARLIDILRKANYRGYVTLEYEADEEPMTAVPKYLQKLRGLLG
jgi:sugar phosphate isomerase/epimerase